MMNKLKKNTKDNSKKLLNGLGDDLHDKKDGMEYI